MTEPNPRPLSNAVLGALGGLAAFGVVALIGILVWFLAIRPTHASAGVGAEFADVSLRVTATPRTVQGGGAITYAFTVANAGPDTATDLNLSDPLPVGVSLRSVTSSRGSCSGHATITCDLGTLKKGGSVEIRVVVTAPPRGTVSNAGQVSSATDDPDASNNPASATTQVQAAAPSADLKISGQAKPEPARVGKQLTVTYSIENGGPDAASGVTFTEAIPAGLGKINVKITQGGDCTTTDSGFKCPLGSLASGASAGVAVAVTPNAAGTLSTVASVSSEATDPDASNNSAATSTTVAAASGGNGKPGKAPDLAVYFCRSVTEHPPFHCLHVYTYDGHTGVHRIPAAASWTLWIRVRGASRGEHLEAHYVDTSSRQAAFSADKWRLVAGANELVQSWTGPFSPHLEFEVVIFYQGRAVNFDPPLLVQFF